MIGKFCAIAHGVKFMANCNHQMDGFSTYPFLTFSKDWLDAYNPKFPNKGDIVIGNDVWLGHNALMMPGVKISDGAILQITNKIFTFNAAVCERFMHCADWFLYLATEVHLRGPDGSNASSGCMITRLTLMLFVAGTCFY